MREIKFRAWMQPDKVMLSHEQLMSIPVKYNEVFEGNSKYPCMQYTGLSDKNGVEIYEGDIVKQSDDLGREVVFYEGCWMLKDHFALYDYEVDNIEVIGNIHENSDLLKC